MATSTPVLALPCLAAADLRTKQYRFVELTAANTVNACNAATDLVYGVLTNKPNTGQGAAVTVLGVEKVIAGAAVAAGARVGTDNQGRAVTKTADADLSSGIAQTAASQAGELIEVLLTPNAQLRVPA